MKLSVLFYLLTFILLTQPLTGQEWKVFNSYEGGFSVLSPGPMESKLSVITTEAGEVDLNTLYYTEQDTSGRFVYLINFYDLPKDWVETDSTEVVYEFLQNTVDQSIEDVSGNLLYANEIEFKDHPGIMWRVEYEGGSMKSKAYIIDKQFIVLQVFSEKRHSLSDNIDQFLDSFRLKIEK